MGVIEDAVAQYRKQYDFYDQAARLVAVMLEAELRKEGIRAIVTSRPKSVQRLEDKVRARNAKRSDKGLPEYESVQDVFDDVVDLAGVRVALYFPGQGVQVDAAVSELFTDVQAKHFPEPAKPTRGTYEKRFPGYAATHYRVGLKDEKLRDDQKRFTEARVEIQVASVLMHAWSEVEHDLVYKPLQGELSEEEYRLLDNLNGMVHAGELVLQSVQEAGQRRVAEKDRPFSNHFELASYILARMKARQDVLGRIDDLFVLLSRLERLTPAKIDPYLESLNPDLERRPISDQVVDQILLEDEDNLTIYKEVQSARGSSESKNPTIHESVFNFLAAWRRFELFFDNRINAGKPGARLVLTPTSLALRFKLSDNDKRTFVSVRELRNAVVHGELVPPVSSLEPATEFLDDLRKKLEAQNQEERDGNSPEA